MPIVWLACHQRRAAFGIAEDQEFGRPQRHADLLGAGGMIDAREYRHAFGCHLGREAVDGCLGAVRAWQRNQAIFGHC